MELVMQGIGQRLRQRDVNDRNIDFIWSHGFGLVVDPKVLLSSFVSTLVEVLQRQFTDGTCCVEGTDLYKLVQVNFFLGGDFAFVVTGRLRILDGGLGLNASAHVLE